MMCSGTTSRMMGKEEMNQLLMKTPLWVTMMIALVNMDGSEDDVLWHDTENDGERGNESNSNEDPSVSNNDDSISEYGWKRR